jgi:hypothetical protein
MLDFISTYFIMDRRKTRIYFIGHAEDDKGNVVEYDIISDAIPFVKIKLIPITKSMKNGTDLMNEIRLHDPENQHGFNNLIL